MNSDGLEDIAAIELGSEFKLYKHFDANLKRLEHDTGTLFVKKTTSKIVGPLSDTIVNSRVCFKCKQGERVKATESNSVRPNQRSYKTGCLAGFTLTAKDKKDGTVFLEITACNLEHNHTTGPKTSIIDKEVNICPRRTIKQVRN